MDHWLEMMSINFYLTRTQTVTQEESQFVTEKECLPLEKEKCKNFPELICDVVTVPAIQQQCQEVQERQVRFRGFLILFASCVYLSVGGSVSLSPISNLTIFRPSVSYRGSL